MPTTKPPASLWAALARHPFASLVAALWVIYAGLTAFVVAIDPFDLFPWGARVAVPTRYDPGNVTRLMRIAAKDAATDTVLIGSSNSAMFTPDDIKAAFPDAHQVWNVSYHGATAYDRLLSTDQFLKYSNARHFIFVFDYFYAQSIHRADNDFPDQFYLDNPMKQIALANVENLEAAARTLRSGTPYASSGALAEERAFIERARRDYRATGEAGRVAGFVEQYRSTVRSRSGRTCADFPAMSRLVDQVATLTRRGAAVDILIPVYSPAVYYQWQGKPELFNTYEKALFEDVLTTRRCIVLATADLGHVRIGAMDDDPAVVADMDHFRDPMHLYQMTYLRRWLRSPLAPETRLTPSNIDPYLNRVRQLVYNYRYLDHSMPSGQFGSAARSSVWHSGTAYDLD